MDISKIRKMLNTRKLVEDAGKIQTKVTEENERLVQVQVNRDLILGERERELEDLKNDHERLQQNMLGLQTQQEALSARYEQELRHRAETLNKHEGIRMIAEALEQDVEQRKQEYGQAKRDQAMIGDVYMKADLQVRNLTQMHVSQITEAKQRNQQLKCQVKLIRMHESKMIEMYNENQKRADATLRELCDLRTHTGELQRKYDGVSAELDKGNSEISNLQREKKNMVHSFNSQMAEARKILCEKDNDLKRANEEIEAFKKTLANQEKLAKMQIDQSNDLKEKLAVMEEQHQKDVSTNENYKRKIEDSTSMCEKLNNDIEKLREEKELLLKEMKYQQETINLHENEIESLKNQLSSHDDKLIKLKVELTNTIELIQKKNEEIEKLDSKNRSLIKDLSEAETGFIKYRKEAEEKLKHQSVTIEETHTELALRTSEIIEANKEIQTIKNENENLNLQIKKQLETIKEIEGVLEIQTSTALKEKEERCNLERELVNKAASIEEVKMELEEKKLALEKEKEERIQLDAALQTLKEELEIKFDTAKENEGKLNEKVSRLESAIRAKDEELSQELGNFLSRRNEFEKEKRTLHEIIDGLEKRIHNIVKEASDIRPAAPRMQPELDNAMTPLTSQPDHLISAMLAKSPGEWLPRESLPTSKRPRQESPAHAKPMAAAAAASVTKTKERRFFKAIRKPYKKY